MSVAPRSASGAVQLALAAGTFAYTYFVWSTWGPMAYFPHIDMTASFVIARDCAEGRGCTMEILPDGLVSILGFVLGAIANHLAAFVYAATGDFHALAPLTQVFFALAAAVTSIAAARRAGPLAGLIAYVLFMRFPVMEGLYRTQWTILMYHFIPLFAACAVLFGIWRARGGGMIALVLTALAVSLAAQTHQTGFALVPSLVALAWMGTPGMTRRTRRLAVAMTAFTVAYALGSYGVIVHFELSAFTGAMLNLHRLHPNLFLLLGAALAATGLLMLVGRSRTDRLPADLVYLTAAVLPLTPIALLPSVNPRYAFTFAPAFAALGGILAALIVARVADAAARLPVLNTLAELLRSPVPAVAMVPIAATLIPWDAGPRWPVMASYVGIVAGEESPGGGAPAIKSGAAGGRIDRPIGVFDLEPVLHTWVDSLGGTYTSAFRRVRAPAPLHREILGTLAMYWPLDADAAPERPRQVALLAAPPGFSLPADTRDWQIFRTDSRYDLAVQIFEPYVDTRIIAWQAMRSETGPGPLWRRMEFAPSKARLMGDTYRWRMMPETYDLAYPVDVPPDIDRVSIRFALRVPGDAPPRALVLQANAAADNRHAIEKIEGVRFYGTLPSLVAVVGGDGVDREGFIEVSITAFGRGAGGGVGYLGMPPSLFEIDPALFEPLLPALRTITAGGTPLPPVLEPIPPLPELTGVGNLEPVRSLTDESGRRVSVREFFTPDGKRRDAHEPTDVTAPFSFVVAVMGLFALLLAGGVLAAAVERDALPQE